MKMEIIKLLYVRFTIFYGHKFTNNHTPEIIEMWYNDWSEGLSGIDIEDMKGAVNHCKLNLKWPPTMSEFIELCDKEAGMPTPQEAMQLAIRRDFTKPIVKTIFDRIGSWNMQHDSEIDLLRKFKEWHAIELCNIREERQKQSLKGVTHGSETAEQRRSIDHDDSRYNGMRKAEGYLQH